MINTDYDMFDLHLEMAHEEFHETEADKAYTHLFSQCRELCPAITDSFVSDMFIDAPQVSAEVVVEEWSARDE